MHTDADDPVFVAPGLLIARSRRGWELTPLGGKLPLPLDLPVVQALVEGDTRALASLAPEVRAEMLDAGVLQTRPDTEPPAPIPFSTAAGAAARTPVPDGAHIDATGVVIGLIQNGALVVEGTGGDPLLLDGTDLQLLDALVEPTTAGELFARVDAGGGPRPERQELGWRLRRLTDAHRVTLLDEPTTEAATAAADPKEVAAPASLSRPLHRRLRALRFPGRVPLGRAARRALGKTRPPASAHPLVDETSADQTSADQTPDPEPSDGGAETAAEAAEAASVDLYLEPPLPHPSRPDAVPVFSLWHIDTGPVLALGMLAATARHHAEGKLVDWYDIRRQEHPSSFLSALAEVQGPAVLLVSNYVWSLADNLAVAREAKAINSDLVVVHGGPSTPKYPDDAVRFFDQHDGIVDIAVRGEGEISLAEALLALGPGWPSFEAQRLAEVEGITYRDPVSGEVVRTPDRDRVADLADLPSPYLTGEFDHLNHTAWEPPHGLLALTFESNRGCPYGCTFCDWGSSTMSRIRKFDLDRLTAEMRWAASRDHGTWMFADANFGIMSRDVELTDRLVEIREELGSPHDLGFNVAKNTTKHLTAILDRLVTAGIAPHFTLALQTRDEATLEAVERTNISTEHYVQLAASFRVRGIPLLADLMLGLPGQTVESLTGDLQFMIEHEIPVRLWLTELLPNAPMNDPAYRDKWKVQTDENLVVTSTASFTAEDRAEMFRLRHAYHAFERFGLLRHVMRFLKWDHDVTSAEVLHRIIKISKEEPGSYPLLSWVMGYFDFYNAPPVGWHSFYREVRRFITTELGVPLSPELDCVLELQRFLMPESGRHLPDTIALDHDYLAYYRAHTAELWGLERPADADQHLSAFGPSNFAIYGDPLDRCGAGIQTTEDPRNEVLTERFWLSGNWEMDSGLVVSSADVAGSGAFVGLHEQMPAELPPEAEVSRTAAVRVKLSRVDSTVEVGG